MNGLANVRTHRCEKERSVRDEKMGMALESQVGTRVRRRHSLPGSLSLHSRSVAARREATQRAATLPILFSWLDALQCAARALRYRLLILRLPSERARPRHRSSIVIKSVNKHHRMKRTIK
ncbi:hypothetical protein ALC56_09662 [Trachymyrmex septentrionalis]|uniref:Uncharacterized protein n=1 Tax=Trachymyrmex septentrionalis TaxID=34720 RepID=A0A195F659_9HYME|nr:hypothetical protein ALC56_09662 [Trachymyrmex septentrionalis]